MMTHRSTTFGEGCGASNLFARELSKVIDPDLCAHMALPDVYDIPYVSEKLLISERQLLIHIEKGELRFIDLGQGKHRMIRFTEAMVLEFIEKRTRLNQPKRIVIHTSRPQSANDTKPNLYRERKLARQAKKRDNK
jgi:hypothetical protein